MWDVVYTTASLLWMAAWALVLGYAFSSAIQVFVSPPRPPSGWAAAGYARSVWPQGSGSFVVALSVLPPTPGPVELRLQVLGVEAGDGLRDARADGTSDGGAQLEAVLHPCGTGYFSGRATIGAEGRWRLERR